MSKDEYQQLEVDADLLEATPTAGGMWHWILASPALLFLAWNWIALVDTVGITPISWVNVLLGCVTFIVVLVLPLGYLAHRVVTALPRLFQASGWEVRPRESVPLEKQYSARYHYKGRERATTNWPRVWLRTAQGWVYLEIAGIFVGMVAMIMLFFSALQFGFGQ